MSHAFEGERVCIAKLTLCFHGGREALVLVASGGQSSPLRACFGCITGHFRLLSLLLFYFILIFYYCSITVVPHFSPLLSPSLAIPLPIPTVTPYPVVHRGPMGPLCMSLTFLLPFFPPLSPSLFPTSHC